MADPGFANGGPRSSDEGARIEAPKASSGRAPQARVSRRRRRRGGGVWEEFLQFIVHSSMDCLKRSRRKKPLLVGKLAVVCMQIALGDKTSVAPSPENFFDFESENGDF